MAGRFEGKRGARARRREPALDRVGDRASELAAGGARLAFTYQGERIEKSVRDLARASSARS